MDAAGKGNDQVRFELAYNALAPHLQVIAPWRIWDIRSREQAIAYAEARGIPLGNIDEKNIYSRDSNLWHISHEGGDLEDPSNRPDEGMYQNTRSPMTAPDEEVELTVEFEKGIPVILNGEKLAPVALIKALNRLDLLLEVGRREAGLPSRTSLHRGPGGRDWEPEMR